MASDKPTSGDVPLREYFEEINAERYSHLQERWEAHQAVHEQEMLTRNEAARRIDARLEMLNELRTEVLTDRERLVSREVFDARTAILEARLDEFGKQIDFWQGREKGLSLSASIVVGLFGLVATAIAIVMALT